MVIGEKRDNMYGLTFQHGHHVISWWLQSKRAPVHERAEVLDAHVLDQVRVSDNQHRLGAVKYAVYLKQRRWINKTAQL